MGTENSTLAIVQPILRHFDFDHLAGGKSFMYGKSINNQVCIYREISSNYCFAADRGTLVPDEETTHRLVDFLFQGLFTSICI